MGFLKKDLYTIGTKMYLSLFICLFMTLFLKGLRFGSNTITTMYTTNPDIIYIDVTTNNFSIVNFLFIFSFIGWSIPSKLFKIDNEVMGYLLTAPKKNFQLLWSKILASSLIMIPFLIISMSIFNCLTINVFIITFLIGLIFIIFASITTFVTNKYISALANVLMLIGIMVLAFVNNPIVRWINDNTYLYAFSPSFPLMIIIKILIILCISIIMVNGIFTFYIRRRKING